MTEKQLVLEPALSADNTIFSYDRQVNRNRKFDKMNY